MPTRLTAADVDQAEQQAARDRLLEAARAAQAEHRPEPGVPAVPTGRIGGQR